MDKKFLVILIAVAVLFFIIGGALGFFYQAQKIASQPDNTVKINAVKTLSSRVIPSITAYGAISNISGRNLTLTFGGESLTVKIKDDAQIFLPSTATASQQTARFADIKKGDNASVNLKLLPDGQIEGDVVIILSKK